MTSLHEIVEQLGGSVQKLGGGYVAKIPNKDGPGSSWFSFDPSDAKKQDEVKRRLRRMGYDLDQFDDPKPQPEGVHKFLG